MRALRVIVGLCGCYVVIPPRVHRITWITRIIYLPHIIPPPRLYLTHLTSEDVENAFDHVES